MQRSSYTQSYKRIFIKLKKINTRIFFSEEVCWALNLLMYITKRKSFYLTCVTRGGQKRFHKIIRVERAMHL